jgi:hypothetical protein
MQKRRLASALAALALAGAGAAAASACHSDTAAAPTDAGADASHHRDASANCVKPDTPNNEQGIGGYCESNDDCITGKSACSGLFGAPDNAWFCTRLCADDPDCGAGLYCAHDPRGIACVPIICGVEEAGTDDAAPDAPTASDAGADG